MGACAATPEPPASPPTIDIEPIVPLRPAPWPTPDPPRPMPRLARCSATRAETSDAGEALRAILPEMRRALDRCGEIRRRWPQAYGGSVRVMIARTESCGFRVLVNEATLGDRTTEACIAGAVSNAVTRKPPSSVDPNVVITFVFGDQVEATKLAPDAASTALAPQREAIARCKHGVDKTFTATAWLQRDDAGGLRVASAGIAPVVADDVRAADCLIDRVKALKLPLAGREPIKVTFEL